MTDFVWQCALWLVAAGLLVQVLSITLVYWAKRAIDQLDMNYTPCPVAESAAEPQTPPIPL